MELEKLRKKIDKIDSEILKLLNSRMEFAVRTKKLKGNVSDTTREEEIVARIKSRSKNLINPEFSEKVFKQIIDESKKLQQKDFKLIGFQGEHGAYSEVAVRAIDTKAIPIPCLDFDEVFDGVKKGQLDLGLVPVENSLGGSVAQVNDLLIDTDLKIVGEIKIPVHHCLLAVHETDYREIKAVYSHSQALSQCRGFISRNKLEARQYYDTAGAAMMISSERIGGAAAIASKLCADLYNLEVLKENIEDHPSNFTRFVLLSKEPLDQKGDKCSVVFSTTHEPGSLFEILKLFSEAKANLTRIESRPMPNDPGKFAFLVDFQGSSGNKEISVLLDKVKKETLMFRFLGCYKEFKGEI